MGRRRNRGRNRGGSQSKQTTQQSEITQSAQPPAQKTQSQQPSTPSQAAYVVKELKKTVNNRPMKLRFSPTAWAKLLFLRDIGDTEVGGFAVTPEDDLLYVDDFILPKQTCGYAHTDLEDEAVADYVDEMIDQGYQPKQILRIWIHTHPNMSASPSGTDENTFERVFGGCDWAVMAIVSRNGDRYCRLQVNGGPFPGAFEIPMEVDYETYDFPASDSEAWLGEYEESVTKRTYTYSGYAGNWPGYRGPYSGYSSYGGYKGPQQSAQSGLGFLPSKSEDSSEEKPVIVAGDFDDDELAGWGEVNFGIKPIQVALSIPDELLQHLTPNQLSLLEDMSPYEREYVLDDLRKRFNIGD